MNKGGQEPVEVIGGSASTLVPYAYIVELQIPWFWSLDLQKK